MRNDEYRVRSFQNLQYSNERKGQCKALAFLLVGLRQCRNIRVKGNLMIFVKKGVEMMWV